ncbi:MAG: multicopper oxidase family protein [Aphanocapsa feldmannii 288cV]|nr:MAG: multicopper oxidase family protein [Aphanocapsa feldmannii 288cV]
MNRRQFLATSAATLLLPPIARARPALRLQAGPVIAHILPEGDPLTPLLGFNGSSPGPEIRARQGDRLSISFKNGSGLRSTIHWHGIHIDNAMDGVPELTQAPVEPGDTFGYAFAVPDAGTYWYHAHHRSWEQVARGLYGPLIVEERKPPRVDRDITVVLDDWSLAPNGELHDSFGNRHDFSHAGRMGNVARALFSGETLRQGDRVRLRLINAATARMFPVKIAGGSGKVVAHDGMPLAEPAPLGATPLMLAPAQRTDIVLDVTGPVSFALYTAQGYHGLGTIAVQGSNPAPIQTPIAPLPPARVQTPDSDGATRLDLVMQGGAMGGRHGGSDFWAFNDRSGIHDAPWRRFARGETARIALHNDTSFPHGIHLHGHHFHEIREDGALGHYRDTTLVDPHGTRDILCVFDNPGRWLLHCHTLGHQASGMKTWVEVA